MAKKGLDGLLKAVQKTAAERRETKTLDVEDLGGGKQMPQSGRSISLFRIHPSPYQPRIDINETFIEGLRESMRTAGLATPILVRPTPEGGYELIDGHRRVIAAQQLEWDEIPAHVRELTDAEAAIQALVTNVDREGYSDYELGRALKRLLDQGVVKSKKALEELTGMSRPAIYRALGLTELPEPMTAILDKYPALIGGNTGDVLAKMVEAGDAALGIEALQKFIDGTLKESHLAQWWALQRRTGGGAEGVFQPHVIKRQGHFVAKIRPGAGQTLAINVKPSPGVSLDRLRAALIDSLEQLQVTPD